MEVQLVSMESIGRPDADVALAEVDDEVSLGPEGGGLPVASELHQQQV